MAVASSPSTLATTDQPANQSGIIKNFAIVASLAIGLGTWFYAAIQPPKPSPCGSEGGPPVTAPRIRLRDGRHLAYEEKGVPKEKARFKIIFCHGFSGSRLDGIRASPSYSKFGITKDSKMSIQHVTIERVSMADLLLLQVINNQHWTLLVRHIKKGDWYFYNSLSNLSHKIKLLVEDVGRAFQSNPKE